MALMANLFRRKITANLQSRNRSIVFDKVISYKYNMPEKISPLDLNFWNLDSDTTHQAIAICVHLESFPEVEEIEKKTNELIEYFPKLKKKIASNNSKYWEEDRDFNFNNHLEIINDENIISTESINNQISKSFSEKLKGNIPPWKIILIGNKNNPSIQSALLIKAHHSLTDGLAIRKLLFFLSNYDEHKKYHQENKPRTNKPSKIALPKLSQSILRLLKEDRRKKASSALNGENSDQRGLFFIDLPGEEFQIIKNKLKSSINDLYLSLISNSLRNYLHDFGLLPNELIGLMPFNLRRTDDFNNLGNNLSAVGIPLPTSEENILNQHKKIKSHTEEVKATGTFGAYKLLAEINSKLPLKLRLKILERAAKKTNFICTNVPGPKLNIYIANAKALSIYGCPALIKHQGIAFALVTYVDRINICIVYDKKIIKKPELLKQEFLQSYKNLKDQLL